MAEGGKEKERGSDSREGGLEGGMMGGREV